MEKDSKNSIPTCDEFSGTVVQSVRYRHPAHYILKIDSFSFLIEMLKEYGTESYESEIFEAGGVNWKLSLYPNGDKERNGEGHISLYLSIPDIDQMLPYGWEVYAEYKFFVLDHIRDEYLIIQDADKKARQFREYKKEWGFTRLIPRNVFDDASKGYLIQDKCAFGVEILVCDYNGSGERFCRPEKPISSNSTYTWKLTDLSNLLLDREHHISPVFTIGNCKWNIVLNIDVEEDEELSVFLQLDDLTSTPRVYATYKMSIKDQNFVKHWEDETTHLFSAATNSSWGWQTFLPLNDIKYSSKGFLVRDTLIIEVEISRISAVKNFLSSGNPSICPVLDEESL